MNLQDEIKKAYDDIHAPDEFTEHLKQKLYQQDFRSEAEELTCEAEELPKRTPKQIFTQTLAFTAAAAVFCVGCGYMLSTMRSSMTEFHPASNVNIQTDTQSATEETTENPDE